MGKLLVIADLDDGSTALERGLGLGHRLGHSVEVVAFAHAPLKRVASSASKREVIKQRALKGRAEQVQKIIDRFSREGQKVTLKVVWAEEIYRWIIRRAEAVAFDAIVKTTHDSSRFGYTSTDWHLLRECDAPVLLVAEKKWQRTKPILAALDLGTDSASKRRLNDLVLSTAMSLAESLGVECRIISAIDVPTLLADLDLVDPGTYAAEHREEMQPYIKKMAAAHDLPLKAFRCKRGPVDKVITSEAARVRAQMVVLGTVGRSGLKAQIIGNTAEEVLQHLRTDVLAIKPQR